MKRNMKFFTIVISLFLVSSLVLTGCMYIIASDKGEIKAYDLNRQSSATGDNIEFEDAPLAQAEMQKKYGIYLHEEDGNIVTIFSEEQYTELKSIRKNGDRIPLTYDEILFLVNDSINIYLKYDEVRLYNAVVDGISHNLHLSSNAEIIYPYHGDYSEFEKYDDAYAQYKKMLEDIYSIIYYRIYVHDAGFEQVTESYSPDKGTVIFAEGSQWQDVSSIVPQYCMQLLSLNGGKVSGEENKELLVGEWEKMVESRKQVSSNYVDDTFVPKQLAAPLLTVYHYVLYDDTRPMLFYQLFITDPNNLQTTKIYPTAELTQLEPRREKIYISGDVNDDDWGPSFALDESVGRFSMGVSSYQSVSLIGKYSELDGVLKLYPENVAPDSEGYYSYVFQYENGAYVYSRENSVPPKGAFDIDDGLQFRLLKEQVYSSQSERPIQNIKDYAADEGIPTDEALEPFFEDEDYIYSFPSIRSQYIIVTFADGTEMPVKEALAKGYISIRTLDVYSIFYYRETRK